MECQEASLSNDSDSLSITGQIVVKDEDSTSPAIKTEFTIQFSAKDASRLGFKAQAKDAFSVEKGTNYFSINYDSAVDEEIYGMGLQYSEWDFKGKSIPLISTEAGVGRGL